LGCPFILTGTVQNHLEKFQQEKDLVKLLKDLFYVDDLCSGDFDLESVFLLYQKAKKILKEGGFNLRKWKTNCPLLAEKLEKREDCLANENKVLGIPWDSNLDVFKFQLKVFAEKFLDMSVTKRKVVSVVAQLLDPLGLLSPIFIIVKVLLQRIHKANSDWDSVVDSSLQKEWRNWLDLLAEVDIVQVPRFYFKGGLNEFRKRSAVELHGFCDASSTAYGAVVYLLIE